MSVAKTILLQLGGNKFKAMTGATNFMDCGDALQFSFKGCRKTNKCKVTLNGSDLYNVQFFKFNRKTFDCPEVVSHSDIYNDQLQSIFAEVTGLYTHL